MLFRRKLSSECDDKQAEEGAASDPNSAILTRPGYRSIQLVQVSDALEPIDDLHKAITLSAIENWCGAVVEFAQQLVAVGARPHA